MGNRALAGPRDGRVPPRAGLEAVRTSTGVTAWTLDADLLPILLTGDRVLAQARSPEPGRLRLVVLETTGTAPLPRVLSEIEVAVGDGVHADFEPGPGRVFSAEALPTSDRRAVVRWEALGTEPTGVFPPPGEGPPAPAPRGAFAVDLDTGAVAALAADTEVVREGHAVPPPVAAFLAGLDPPSVAFEAGSVFAHVGTEPGDGGPRVVLRRWSVESGDLLAERVLPAGFHLKNASSDGRHVLVARYAEEPPGPDTPHLWRVFDLESGGEVAAFEAPLGAAPFVVADPVLLYQSPGRVEQAGTGTRVVPARLHAVLLATGLPATRSEPGRATSPVPPARPRSPRPVAESGPPRRGPGRVARPGLPRAAVQAPSVGPLTGPRKRSRSPARTLSTFPVVRPLRRSRTRGAAPRS